MGRNADRGAWPKPVREGVAVGRGGRLDRRPRLTGAVLTLALLGSEGRAQTAPPVCDGAAGYQAGFAGRRTFLLRPDWMQTLKARWAEEPHAVPGVRAVMRRADAALSGEVYTVVDKTALPASGDRHDYMSMGPYWWPDPARPGGLPYVRRDGEVNPERATNAFDATDMSAMSGDVRALAFAYFLTDDRRYAERAATLVRAWFLSPDTRMNPNLTHAQAVPGRVPGRAEGVIDADRLTPVVEALGLIEPSGVFSDGERARMRTWFAELVAWMATSPNGLAEKAAQNNHSVFYDLLISHFALYAGQEEVARAVIGRFGEDRISRQIEPDGRLPQELERTRSLHYSTWTLAAAFDVAELGRCVQVDLWNYSSPDGRSLRGATDYLAEWAGREGEWPWPERDRSAIGGLHEVLLRGAWAWSDPGLAAKSDLYAGRREVEEIGTTIPPFVR